MYNARLHTDFFWGGRGAGGGGGGGGGGLLKVYGTVHPSRESGALNYTNPLHSTSCRC